MILDWFPQQYASEFFFVKGVLGTITCALLFSHLGLAWRYFTGVDQRLAFFGLMATSLVITFSSIDLFNMSSTVDYTNLANMLLIIIIMAIAFFSLNEDLQRHRRDDA